MVQPGHGFAHITKYLEDFLLAETRFKPGNKNKFLDQIKLLNKLSRIRCPFFRSKNNSVRCEHTPLDGGTLPRWKIGCSVMGLKKSCWSKHYRLFHGPVLPPIRWWSPTIMATLTMDGEPNRLETKTYEENAFEKNEMKLNQKHFSTSNWWMSFYGDKR